MVSEQVLGSNPRSDMMLEIDVLFAVVFLLLWVLIAAVPLYHSQRELQEKAFLPSNIGQRHKH